MKKSIRFLVGILISAACLWWVLKDFEWSTLSDSLRSAHWEWLIVPSIIYPLGFVLRTFRWKIIMSPIAPIRSIHLFPILTFGYLINNILPARAGEFARAYVAARETKTSVSSILGTVVVERISDFLGIFFVILLALKAVPADLLPIKKIGISIAAGLVFISIVLCIGLLLNKRKKNEQSGWVFKIRQIIQTFISGFLALKSPYKIGGVLFLSILIWINEATVAFLVARIFSLHLSIYEVGALMIGFSVGVMVPAAPGYIGTYEFFGKQMLNLMGYTGPAVVPFVLFLHIFSLGLSCLIGLPYLFKMGMVPKEKP